MSPPPTGDDRDAWTVTGPVSLGDAEAHVWRFPLDPPPAVLARFETTLNADEIRRADRFRTADLRRRFVAGRGGLRSILSAYLGRPAETIAFAYGPHGKPVLVDPPETGPVEFNLTHSHELALCAVTRIGAVGVDVEAVRSMEEDGRKLIGRFFSAREQFEFLELPESERLAAFFRGWTRKEAFLKATGTGLATVLDSFDVTLGPAAPAALLRVGDDPAEASRWTLVDLDPGPGYFAALAVAAGGRAVVTNPRTLGPSGPILSEG